MDKKRLLLPWRLLTPTVHATVMGWENMGPLALGMLFLPNWWARVLTTKTGIFEILALWIATFSTTFYTLHPYSGRRYEARNQLHAETAAALFAAPVGLWLALHQGVPLVALYWTLAFLLAVAVRRAREPDDTPLRWVRVENPARVGRVVAHEVPGPEPEPPPPKEETPSPAAPPSQEGPFLVFSPKAPPAKDPEEARERLRAQVYLPPAAEEEVVRLLFLLKEFRAFRETWGLEPPSTVLLVGPPGTGKTSVARFLAEASGFPLVAASPSMLHSKWYGESERLIRDLFTTARRLSPAVVYLDEVESLAPSRDSAHEATGRNVAQLLQELDGIGSEASPIFLLASTNLPEKVDPALISRFAATITIPLPDLEARKRILALLLKERGQGLDLSLVASHTEGFSGRDLKTVVQRAATQALLEGRRYLTDEDLLREVLSAKKLRG